MPPLQRPKLPPEFLRFQEHIEAARAASNSPEFLDDYITPNFTARVEVRFKAILPDGSPEIDGTYIRVDGARPDGPPNVRARRYQLRTDNYSGGIDLPPIFRAQMDMIFGFHRVWKRG